MLLSISLLLLPEDRTNVKFAGKPSYKHMLLGCSQQRVSCCCVTPANWHRNIQRLSIVDALILNRN
jgi:hypothetical protein